MTEQSRETEPRPRRRRVGLFVLLSAVLAAGGLAALLIVARGGFSLPAAAVARIEARLNAGMGDAAVRLGGVSVLFRGAGIVPLVRLTDVVILGRERGGADAGEGARRAGVLLPEIDAQLDGTALLTGDLQPSSVTLHGAELNLSRDADGSVGIAFGELRSVVSGGASPDLEEIMLGIEHLFGGRYLYRLRKVEARDVRITFADALTDRVWETTNARLAIEQDSTTISATLALSLGQADGVRPTAYLSVIRQKGAQGTQLRIRFSDLRAHDIAGQAAAMAWLNVLEAPISGSVAVDIAPGGRLSALTGALEIGAGTIRVNGAGETGAATGTDAAGETGAAGDAIPAFTPSEDGPAFGTEPVPFDNAKAYFSFDDDAGKLTFDQISLTSEALTIIADGQAYLQGFNGGHVDAIVGQLHFSRVELAPPGVFAGPVSFSDGALDLRVGLNPLSIDIGQFVLTGAQTRLQLSGNIASADDGWHVALDLASPSLGRDRLLALWPTRLKDKTREWIEENLERATFTNIVGAIRKSGPEPARLALNFDFGGAAIRFMRAMPLLEQGRGYGVITESRLDMSLVSGTVMPPRGGAISLDGSTLAIPDITVKAGRAEIALTTASRLRAALEILDHAPFGFLTKAGIATNIATGRVTTEVSLDVPLREGITFDDVGWHGTGRITGASSDKLIRDKTLIAPLLEVRADEKGVVISGDGRLATVPVSGSWDQRFGPEHNGHSRVQGTVELSQAFLDAFSIALPDGSVEGAGVASVEIDLSRGEAPAFSLVSDLNRVTLELDELGWRKPAATLGHLEVTGALSQPATIDRLEIDAAGLSAIGSVKLTDEGALDVAAFESVNLGDWMAVPVELRGQGPGESLRIVVLGGWVDMRRATFSDGDGSDHADDSESHGAPIDLRLDRLIISEGISLTGVEGNLDTRSALNGRLNARVNGAAPVVVTLAPTEHGTGIRLIGEDGGAVMAASGIFTGAHGGSLELVLEPTGETRTYTGTVKILETRAIDAPGLAELLSAISVIGLLEQLSGTGIVFSEVEARLHLSPRGLTIRRGSAVGPSMGLSMEGTYDFSTELLDMQGEVTPIYMLNGILEQMRIFGGLFGRTKGEGVLGFTYRMAGSPDAPEVSVNPLSALTPGVFRQIFRRKPASLPGEAEDGADASSSDATPAPALRPPPSRMPEK